MSAEREEENKVLAHHEQLPLCTTRLPYRQGRKLTAVKVYTINNESNNLLIFGVPSLNLRQETKALFAKFGKLLHFSLSKNHPAEVFTETYHARYERIQSARIAKRMIDTKNFYGGSLHVCYAPELETLGETRNKLLIRKKDVVYRLRNLQKETTETVQSNTIHDNRCISENSPSVTDIIYDNSIVNEIKSSHVKEDLSSNVSKINMGDENVIYLNKNKRKANSKAGTEKRFKPCFEGNNRSSVNTYYKELNISDNVDIIDCTSVQKDIVSNIDEGLNYNKFGNEIIRKVEEKPLNRIIFNCNKKS